MRESSETPPNISKDLYYKICRLLYSVGAPNYWYEDFKLPKYAKIAHDCLSRLLDLLVSIYLVALVGAFFTQNNLNDKQKSDRVIVSSGLTFICMYVPIVSYKRNKVRDVGYNLICKIKEYYNDTVVEQQMIKQVRFYITGFGIFTVSTIVMFGVTGAAHVISKGETFVTVITAWPDVEDTSEAAGAMRIIAYFMYYVVVVRTYPAAYMVVISVPIILSYQYRNLCSYFYSLEDIFKADNLSQEEKENKYEEAFKIGIKLHSITLRCTKLTQDICNAVFSLQLVLNDTVLLFLMIQMVNSERTLVNATSTAMMTSCTLISTGCLWWNAGDVTVEASHLSTAMFHSGWHHCRKEAARRIRPMIVISMWQSQRPVQLRCLGIVDLSYQSFVTVVKSAYSIFSVLY